MCYNYINVLIYQRKCEDYWIDEVDKVLEVDDFTVGLTSVQRWPDYAVRMLCVKKVGQFTLFAIKKTKAETC